MDDVDFSNERAQEHEEASIKTARIAAASIPIGEGGECQYCGYEFERIVNGACGRCRDEFKLG